MKKKPKYEPKLGNSTLWRTRHDTIEIKKPLSNRTSYNEKP